MSVRNALALLFAVFSAVMIGAAVGAVWMLPTLYMQRPLPWLAVPIGWLMGRIIRGWVRTDRAGAVPMAALATAVACAYVGMLTTAARIAGSMGLGLVDAIRTAGLGLLWQLTELASSRQDLIWFAAGIGLACAAAARPTVRRKQAD